MKLTPGFPFQTIAKNSWRKEEIVVGCVIAFIGYGGTAHGGGIDSTFTHHGSEPRLCFLVITPTALTWGLATRLELAQPPHRARIADIVNGV